MRSNLQSVVFTFIFLLTTPCAIASDKVVDAEFFELKIRPVLMGTCLKCHGGDRTKVGIGLSSFRNDIDVWRGRQVSCKRQPTC